MNNNDDVFLKQMKGVKPIKKNNRVGKENPKTPYKVVKKTKVKQTNTTITKPETIIKKTEFDLERVSIKKSIKKGSFKIDKKIDFHGKTLLESEERFSSSISECYNSGHRCLLFVTGKGLFKTKDLDNVYQPKLYHGVIRSAFINWVKSKKFSKHILSFEQASVNHGGDGAFYVYLRKKKTNFVQV